MRAVLKAHINKTDRNDARGMAPMMRVGRYRPVHVKTLRSQKLRMLLTHRKLLQSKAIANDNDLRGILRNFDLKVGMADTSGDFHTHFHQHVRLRHSHPHVPDVHHVHHHERAHWLSLFRIQMARALGKIRNRGLSRRAKYRVSDAHDDAVGDKLSPAENAPGSRPSPAPVANRPRPKSGKKIRPIRIDPIKPKTNPFTAPLRPGSSR